MSRLRRLLDRLELTSVRAALEFVGIVILFLCRVLPSPRPKTREIWPGAVAPRLFRTR